MVTALHSTFPPRREELGRQILDTATQASHAASFRYCRRVSGTVGERSWSSLESRRDLYAARPTLRRNTRRCKLRGHHIFSYTRANRQWTIANWVHLPLTQRLACDRWRRGMSYVRSSKLMALLRKDSNVYTEPCGRNALCHSMPLRIISYKCDLPDYQNTSLREKRSKTKPGSEHVHFSQQIW